MYSQFRCQQVLLIWLTHLSPCIPATMLSAEDTKMSSYYARNYIEFLLCKHSEWKELVDNHSVVTVLL